MSEAHSSASASCAVQYESGGNTASLGAADWLCLAAAPAFAIMALITGVLGSPDMICSALPDASPLSGMAVMYTMMSAFHAAPWLNLISRWSAPASPERCRRSARDPSAIVR